jgi:pyruvate dehydrogenase E2 component (dihydrolipoamide acetyltransferase)
MPALEMAQETGKLLAWRKQEGESVAKGEILLEIETDKAVMEIESPGDGVLAGIQADPGTDVPVGQTIAWILAPGEGIPQQPVRTQSGRRITAEPVRTTAGSAAAPTIAAEVRISPKARRLAREHGIDISSLRGSGPDGAIVEKDILAAIDAGGVLAQPAVGQGRVARVATDHAGTLSSIARLMAERTTQSWTTVPHFFVARELDATALNAFREMVAATNDSGLRVSHTDLLVALSGRALRKHPGVNASWVADSIKANPDVNVAIAIAVEDGVVAPVIHHADTAKLTEIAKQRHDLADRARAGKLRPADLSGGTFTLSNLGMYNVDAFHAIITPPQAAILAVGRIADRVVAVNGQPAIRPMMTMTLSCDHRVIDGARAALFLNDLSDAISRPEQWLE